MTIYDRLGITPVVNGVGTVTRLGGSLMPPEVLEAMVDAGQHYVPLQDLQAAAGRRLAELTHNEAAYVSSGAAAGLVLATAACITGDDPAKMGLLPRPEQIPGGRYKVVVHRCQRNGYDFAVRQVGIELVEIGPTRDEAAARQTTENELEAAIESRTAAVIYFAGAHFVKGALPLEDVVRIAHARGVPVIVDAAAQVPPIENLWHFTGRGGPALWSRALRDLGIADPSFPALPVPPLDESEGGLQVKPAGADLAIYSGGKGLRGPQSSGLILGRADLIAAIARQGNPNAFIGRPMKVGKEEICGLVAAVECYLGQDFRALAARYEQDVRHVVEAVSACGIPGVIADRTWPNEAGQPMPRARVRFAEGAPLSRDDLQQRLLAANPPIELSNAGADGVFVNPQNLRPGDEAIIADTLCQILRAEEGRKTKDEVGTVGLQEVGASR
jgi:D-glucosaminate-6-phosphate ammonia-lyase